GNHPLYQAADARAVVVGEKWRQATGFRGHPHDECLREARRALVPDGVHHWCKGPIGDRQQATMRSEDDPKDRGRRTRGVACAPELELAADTLFTIKIDADAQGGSWRNRRSG